MERINIGIDPGKSGGFAIIWEDGKITVCAWDNEEFVQHMRLVKSHNVNVMCCLEKVGAMPGQGVTSMFSFGKSVGFIEGVLSAIDIPYQVVMPRRWKSEFILNSDKQKSITVCKSLFPSVDLKRTPKCTTDHDGKAESLLMALYAKRKL